MNEKLPNIKPEFQPVTTIDISHINKVTFIMITYGDKLATNIKNLCAKCAYAPKCNILPVTTSGEDCPYFKE